MRVLFARAARAAGQLAVVLMLGLAPPALAQIEAPATLDEQPGQFIPLDRLPSDYNDFPDLSGGWDLFLDFRDGLPADYAGSYVFAGLGEFYYHGQVVDPETGRLISPVGIFQGMYRTVDSKPGWKSWVISDLHGGNYAMNARFLSPEVAIAEDRATPSSTRVQRFMLLHNACDYRFADDDKQVIEGCKWLPMTGDLLREAYLSGECAEGLSCFRLVSDLYYLNAH